MTRTTREHALETALLLCLPVIEAAWQDSPPPMPASPGAAAREGRAALALPPEPDVNADMLAALLMVEGDLRIPEMTRDAIRAAIVRATGREDRPCRPKS